MKTTDYKNGLGRRDFLKLGAASAAALTFRPVMSLADKGNADFPAVPARHWKSMPDNKVQCQLCPKICDTKDKERGYCGVRENRDGKYYTLVHSRACSAHIDPIEKKPLYHFLPSTNAFSIATPGCNFECKFCQNWEISQYKPEEVNCISLTPKQVAEYAKRNGTSSIAYTYSEPTIFFEYMYDCAVEGNKLGIRSAMISNGYIQAKPMTELTKVLAGVKIDLKSFTENFYFKYCNGELKPVLGTLELLKKSGIWFEIVVLIIPTLNDSIDENKQMAKWIKTNLGPDVPVHFTRFYPTYKIKNLPRTPIKTIETIHDAAKAEGLHYVYSGNMPGHPKGNTYCHSCGELLIKRWGFQVAENNITPQGACPKCKTKIPGYWK
ncbi:MAG: AmmeMemoRadiSam system radical SAM enzyme [Acidobacteria bacterium]|nr:AmmeMemoRadiSam system radical SAM enzyme [Acidobacteriota bacterium]